MEKNILQEFLDEGVGNSTVRVTKITKRSQQAGAEAMRMAQKINAPEYQKYVKFRKLMLDAKQKIMRKYARKAMTIVKQKM